MFSLDQIKKEINKMFQADYLQTEVNRLKQELLKLDAFKKIQEPTQQHLNQLEKQYRAFSKKITSKQADLDKEFNSTVTALKKRRSEAEAHIKDLQKLALNQKKSIEKLIRKQMRALGLAQAKKKKKKKKKKAAAEKKSTAKKAAKAKKKSSSKKAASTDKKPKKKSKSSKKKTK